MPSLRLPESLRAFGGAAFPEVLTGELERAGVRGLGLEQSASQGGRIPDHSVRVSLIRAGGEANVIRLRVGVFFTEVVGGCSCGDDPYEVSGYTELSVTLDRATGRAQIAHWDEGGPDP